MSDALPDVLWSYTWPTDDTRHDWDDFTAHADGRPLGRIYPVKTSAFGTVWKWFSWTPGVIPNSGQEPSRLAAMRMIEQYQQ